MDAHQRKIVADANARVAKMEEDRQSDARLIEEGRRAVDHIAGLEHSLNDATLALVALQSRFNRVASKVIDALGPEFQTDLMDVECPGGAFFIDIRRVLQQRDEARQARDLAFVQRDEAFNERNEAECRLKVAEEDAPKLRRRLAEKSKELADMLAEIHRLKGLIPRTGIPVTAADLKRASAR